MQKVRRLLLGFALALPTPSRNPAPKNSIKTTKTKLNRLDE